MKYGDTLKLDNHLFLIHIIKVTQMFNKYNVIYSLYYIGLSITHYKQTMILPLWKLERKKRLVIIMFIIILFKIDIGI